MWFQKILLRNNSWFWKIQIFVMYYKKNKIYKRIFISFLIREILMSLLIKWINIPTRNIWTKNNAYIWTSAREYLSSKIKYHGQKLLIRWFKFNINMRHFLLTYHGNFFPIYSNIVLIPFISRFILWDKKKSFNQTFISGLDLP